MAHQRRLALPACRVKFDPTGLPEQATVVTFARSSGPVRRISAQDRLLSLPEGDIVLSHFDSSPMYALLLWDIAHQLKPGRCIYLQASSRVAALLERTYYQPHFSELPDTSSHKGLRCFLKHGPLPAEADRGLDAWSFCIPTGDGCPAALNACVARILALGIPRFEILLCGKPRSDFLYAQHARVIGEEIKAPPIHITRKKNLLAQEAQYPNLCILHDRVLLPENFYQAVQRFGDDFPYTAFPSFWFADTWQAVPRRYSDFCRVAHLPAALDGNTRPNRASLPLFEQMGFMMQHPARADFGRDYLTGSLYLCKHHVWQHLPQNEALYWAEYEDVEHGLQAAKAGIPSRLNPYAMTQSQCYRSIFHHGGASVGPDCRGRIVKSRSPIEWWGFPRRPALGLIEQEGRDRLAAFARRYTGNDELVRQAPRRLTGLRRYKLIARLLWRVRGDTRMLLQDWYREVLCEPFIWGEAEKIQAVLDGAYSTSYRKIVMLRHLSLLRQVFNNPFSSPFKEGQASRRPAGRRRRRFGALLSALWLKYGSRHSAFALSLLALWQTIYRGVPGEKP